MSKEFHERSLREELHEVLEWRIKEYERDFNVSFDDAQSSSFSARFTKGPITFLAAGFINKPVSPDVLREVWSDDLVPETIDVLENFARLSEYTWETNKACSKEPTEPLNAPTLNCDMSSINGSQSLHKYFITVKNDDPDVYPFTKEYLEEIEILFPGCLWQIKDNELLIRIFQDARTHVHNIVPNRREEENE